MSQNSFPNAKKEVKCVTIIKRAVSAIAALSIAVSVLPISLSSAKTIDDGVLKWTFETDSDFASKATLTEEEERAEFQTGVWSREAGSWNTTEIKTLMKPVKTDFDTVGKTLSNGGSYCAMLQMTNEWSKRRSLAMAITLSDGELIPNKEYTLEFDVLGFYSWERYIYTGFSKPSERTTSTNSADTNDSLWLFNGSAKLAKLDNGKLGITNEGWAHATIKITPDAADFEDGKIIFYLGGAHLGATGGVDGDEKLYIDNVTLTPEDDTVSGELQSELEWNFEQNSDVAYYTTSMSEEQEKQAFLSGAWAREAGSWNDTEITSKMMPVITDSGTLAKQPADGGKYCVGLSMTNEWNKRRSLGMAISLNDEQLVPNRSYTLEFDAYYSYSWERSMYAGFSKPSERTVSTHLSASEATAWLHNDSFTQATINGEKKGITNGDWSHMSITLTPKPEYFEDGRTILYLAGVNTYSDGVGGGEKIYIDNIVLKPNAPTAGKPIVTKTQFGKYWSFEKDADNWQTLGGESLSAIETKNVQMYKAAENDHGYTGAVLSEKCIAGENISGDDYVLGTKVLLARNELDDGIYRLKARAGATTSVYNLHAAIFAGDADIDAASESAARTALSKALCDVDLGELGTFWSAYSADIRLLDSYFENGYCTLVLYTGPGQMDSGERLYLDEISFTAQNRPELKSGKSVSGYVTSIFDYELAGGMTIAALKDGNTLKSVSADKGKFSGVNHSAFTNEIPMGTESPSLKLYMWTKGNLTPLCNEISAAEVYRDGELECDWESAWTDTSKNRYNELEAPSEYPNGKRTARLSANDGKTLVAAVYDNSGSVYDEGIGTSFEISVPADSDYTVKISARDEKNHIISTLGEYDKTAFDRLTAYPTETITASGMVYQAGFEHEILPYVEVADGAEYSFVNGYAIGGRKSLYIYNRTAATSGIQIDSLKLAGKKVTLNAYVRSDESVPDTTIKTYLAAVTLTPSDESASAIKKNLGITRVKGGKNWAKISQSIDLSQYNASDYSKIVLNLSEISKTSFYVDDFVVTTDGEGYRKDDSDTGNYAGYILDGLSSTPYEQSTNQADWDVDKDTPTLKDVYKDYFKLGACNGNQMCGENNTSPYARLFWKNFNTTVSDGAFKKGWIRRNGFDQPYCMDTANRMMYFCYKNGLTDIAGHTLWGHSSEVKNFSDENGNLLDRDGMLKIIKDDIEFMLNHFDGKGEAENYYLDDGSLIPYDDYKNWRIAVWDIANEISADWIGKGGCGAYRATSDGVTEVDFYKVIGPDYAQWMYKYARDVNPDTELRLNDFEDQQTKRAAFLQILSDMNAPNNVAGGQKLVDKIGLQTHLTPDMDPSYVRESIEMYTATGLGLDISEVDFQAHSFEPNEASQKKFEKGITKMREFEQAILLRDMFEVFKEFSDDIERVTFWTFTDRYAFLNTFKTDYPGLFDRNFNPKPMFWAIASSEEEFYERYPEAKLLFGKTEWHFDYESDITFSFNMGSWTRSVPEQYDVQPIILDDGEDGGYMRCVRRWRESDNEGIRIKLSGELYKPGKTYTLTFKTKFEGSNPAGEAGRPIYAAFTKPSTLIKGDDSAAAFLLNGINCGNTATEWTEYSVQITPKASDFEDGYTSLYLCMPGGIKTNKKTYLCFDDISIH